MKWYRFKYLILFLLFPMTLLAQEGHYEKRVRIYKEFWNNLIPRYSKVQFAGSMGMLSVGGGWNYGKDHWETDIFLGLVPRNADRHAMVTLTIKQNYIPWRVSLNEKISFEPLSCGLYVNTLLDKDFWVINPDKYPDGYYTFSTRIRFHAFLGERITFQLDKKKFHNKSITLFYEISTCDLYLISAIQNSYLKPSDYLSLSFGVKFQIL